MAMMLENVKLLLFQHYPFADIRDRKPTIYFQVPVPYFLRATTDDAATDTTIQLGIIPLDWGFWISTFLLLCGQAMINILVAFIAYEFLLPSNPNRFLIGYGIVIPTLILAPLWIARQWQCPNVGGCHAQYFDVESG